jgi:hypothetical protein
MHLAVSFFLALGAAFVVLNIVQTMSAYPSLPGRVPMGLGLNGAPSSFAPRPFIWFAVCIQVVVACVIAWVDVQLANHAPGTHGTLLGSSLASAAVMALIWRVQSLLIASAEAGGKPVSMGSFWRWLIACMATILFAAFVIG